MKTVIRDEKQNIIAELELLPESLYSFSIETIWGTKDYELKPTYHFVSETHSKDYSKPSGMVLTGKK